MASTFNISVGADTTKFERDIQAAGARLRKPIDIKIKDNASSALGNITGKTTKFNDALDAATARVVAFGAAAGAFNLVRKGIEELLRSTVEVETSLAKININLGESEQNLKQFSKNIFDIARNTGQTFETAAKAAEELTRQGLTATETTIRLRDALILSRLAAIDSGEAVNTLTASVNSFAKEALSSTEILNKLAAVDAKFAVSTADLASAISRVGSSASDAGVSFDELLGIVTSVQQTTARGGAVIGNALKTIFTRIERSSTLDDLEALGVGVRDVEGKTLPAIQVLTKLANTYDTLSDAQKSLVAEQVGGVFQINILKAALGDLGKEYSVYSRALVTAQTASNEAFRKNEILNKTLSASFNDLKQSVSELFAEFGKVNLSPFIKTITDGLSGVAKFLSGSNVGKDAGKSIGENILQGIGNVLTGPGVVALAAIVQSVVSTLARKVGAEFGDAVAASMLRSGVLGGATQAGKIAQVRKIVPRAASGMLPSIMGESAAISAGVGGASPLAKPVVIPNFNFGGGKRGPVVANTDEYMVPNYAGGSGSAIFNKNMASMYGLPRNAKRLAEGYVPNFASIYRGVNPKFGDINAGINSIGIGNKLVAAVGRGNYTDNKEIARLYGSSVVSKNIKEDKLLELSSYSDIVRLYEKYLPRSLASQIKNSSGTEQLRLIQGAGKNLTNILLQKGYSGIKAPFAGGDSNFLSSKGMGGNLFIPFAGGYVPNFAKISSAKISGEYEKKRRLATESGSELEYLFNPKKRRIEIDHIRSEKKGEAFELFSGLLARAKRGKFPVYSGVLSRQYGKFDPKSKKYNEIAYNTEQSNYENLLRAYPQLRYRDQPGLKNSFKLSMVDTRDQSESFERIFGSLRSAETFINKKSKWDFARYFKNDQFSIGGLTTKPFAGGYVPNFSRFSKFLPTTRSGDGYNLSHFFGGADDAIGAAINREKAAGVPSNQIYIDRDRRVINKNNPTGILIANRHDEPLGGHEGVTRMLKQGRNPAFAGLDEAYDATHFYNKASGYVPNFAISPDRGDRFSRQEFVKRGFFIEKDKLDNLNALFNTMRKVNGRQFDAALEKILKIEKEIGGQSPKAGGLITGRRLGYQKAIANRAQNYTGGGEPIPFEDIPAGSRSVSGGFGGRIGFGEPPLLTSGIGSEASKRAAKTLRKENRQLIEAGILENIRRGDVVGDKDISFLRAQAQRRVRGSKEFKGVSNKDITLSEPLSGLFANRVESQIQGVREQNAFNQKQKKQQALQSRLLGLSIVSSFAAPAIESGINSALGSSKGGTAGGAFGGLAGGALQGAGIGAILGPQGAIAGAAIGGLVGVFNKLTKSAEELNAEFADFSAEGGKKLEGIQQYIQSQSDLEEAISSGADSKVIGRLQKRVSSQIANVSPETASRLSAAQTLKERTDILREESDKTEKQITRRQEGLSLSGTSGTVFSGLLTRLAASTAGEKRTASGLLASPLGPVVTNAVLRMSSSLANIYTAGRQANAEQSGRLLGSNAENFNTLNSSVSSKQRKELISFLGNNQAGFEQKNRQTLQNVINELGKTIPAFKDVSVTAGNFDELNIAVNEAITTARTRNKLTKEEIALQEKTKGFISQRALITKYFETQDAVQGISSQGNRERRGMFQQTRLGLLEPTLTSANFRNISKQADLNEIQARKGEDADSLTRSFQAAIRGELASTPAGVGLLGQEALLKNNPAELLKVLNENGGNGKAKELIGQYNQELQKLNATVEQSIATTEQKYKLEEAVEKVQRRRTSFLGGSSLGKVESVSNFGKAFDNFPANFGSPRARGIAKTDAFLGLANELKQLSGFTPLSQELISKTKEVEGRKQGDVLRNIAAEFLGQQDISRPGLYKNRDGTPYSEASLKEGLIRYRGTSGKGSEQAAIADELLKQFEVLSRKEDIGNRGWNREKQRYESSTIKEKETLRKWDKIKERGGENKEVNDALLAALQQQQQTVEQLGKTKVTIESIINGTVTVVSEALSKGQTDEISKMITEQVQAVLSRTTREINSKVSAATGNPLPPTAVGNKVAPMTIVE